MRKNFVERYGKIEQMDRSFALKFWQAQTPTARFDASWELIVHAMKVKGHDVRHSDFSDLLRIMGRSTKSNFRSFENFGSF